MLAGLGSREAGAAIVYDLNPDLVSFEKLAHQIAEIAVIVDEKQPWFQNRITVSPAA
jgi:hypothetical protein